MSADCHGDPTRGDAQTWTADETLLYELLDSAHWARVDPAGGNPERPNAQWYQEVKQTVLDELSHLRARVAEEEHALARCHEERDAMTEPEWANEPGMRADAPSKDASEAECSLGYIVVAARTLGMKIVAGVPWSVIGEKYAPRVTRALDTAREKIRALVTQRDAAFLDGYGAAYIAARRDRFVPMAEYEAEAQAALAEFRDASKVSP